MNRDGRADLVTSNADAHDVSVLLGRGDGSFDRAQDFALGHGPLGIAVADFNGDDRPDFVTANSSSDVSVLLARP